MILPAATLMLTAYGSYTLVVRSSLLETLGEDYVLTARAKGLPVRRIVWRHAVRNALLPMVTLIALDFGYIVGGAAADRGHLQLAWHRRVHVYGDHPAGLPDAAGRVPDPHGLRDRAEFPV